MALHPELKRVVLGALGILVPGVMGFVANAILERRLAPIACRYDINP